VVLACIRLVARAAQAPQRMRSRHHHLASRRFADGVKTREGRDVTLHLPADAQSSGPKMTPRPPSSSPVSYVGVTSVKGPDGGAW
jgi:hypothetical protein